MSDDKNRGRNDLKQIRTTRRGRWAVLLLAALSLSLFAAACGGDDEAKTPAAGSTTAPSPTVKTGPDYSKLSGEVRVDGSSTVFPISQAVAEEFSKVAKNVRANVALSGTGGGFEKFCRKEIQVSDASRPINQKEKDACAAAGIPATDIVEVQVAIDALTVVVNPQNTWAKCMTTAQLTRAFQKDGATKWSDIDPTWPAVNIKFYFPGADSGTFDYFKEAAKLRGEASKEPPHRADGTASEDDNVLVRGIEGDKNSIGYFGFAYYENEGKKLKAVEVDGGAGCVAPSFDAALKGTYKPLSRPLFIYTTQTLMKEKPEVAAFVNFYTSNMAKLAKEVGYVSLPADLVKAQQDKVAAFAPK